MGIFSDNAPFYWDAKIPVMPLKKRQKAPILMDWTTYGANFPSIAVRETWMTEYPDSNIGLPFGEASGVCAVDIDTVDEALVEMIMDCLPASPWVRVGKKGCGLIFKWSGQKNFKIRHETDGMICEFLGKGNQLVMPPSIHPDTGLPYTSNVNLWDVMDKIQALPHDIEARLREALGVKGMKLAHEGRSAPMVVVPQGERDIQLVRRAGYYARVVLGIDKSAQFTLAAAMQHMHTWVTDFTKGAAGDDMDPEKGVAKLLEFLLKDIESGKTMPDGWDNGLTASQLEHPAIAAMSKMNEVARWTPSKARIWLDEQVALKEGDLDWAVQKVQELIKLLAADDQFSDFQLEALQSTFVTVLGKGTIAKPAVKRAFVEARNGHDQADEETDEDHEAIARRVLEIINREGELRYASGSFWQWNGSCFIRFTDEAVTSQVMKLKGNVLNRRAADYKAITGVIKILANRELMEETAEGVNFANGFLDSDGELHDHAPRFGQTFTMPFNYAPERAGEAHKWFAFLERVWGDDTDYAQKVAALQEGFAVTMFGNATRFQRALLLYGRAQTGKSTVLSVLESMMPPAAVCSIPPDTWASRFVMSSMVGKTLNSCGELSDTTPIDGRTFKEVIEGKTRETEYKGQDAFRMKPIAAQWFASNYLPVSRDGSQGFLRRWLILHFANVIESDELIREFDKVLVSEEREAIAAWAVQGMARLVKQRDYTLPATHHSHINSVRRANNSVSAWLQDNTKVKVAPEHSTWADASSIFEYYKWYMKDKAGLNSNHIPNFERFKQMMEELGHNSVDYLDPLGENGFKMMGIVSKIPVIA